MSSEYKCPNCGVTDTRYRSTFGSHICNRCGHQWGGSTKPANRGWFSQVIQWAKAHPFGTLLTLSVLFTISAIASVSEPESWSGGERVAIWIVAVILWAVTFGYWKYRKYKESREVVVDDKN